MVTSHDLLPRFKEMLKNLPEIKTIIYMEDQLQKTCTAGFRSDVNIVGFRNVVANVSLLNVIAKSFCQYWACLSSGS